MKKLAVFVSICLTAAVQAANPDLRVHAESLEGIAIKGDVIAFTIPKGIVQMVVKSDSQLSRQPFAMVDCKVTVTRWIPDHLSEKHKVLWGKYWADSCAVLTNYLDGPVDLLLSNHRIVLEMSRIKEIDSRMINFATPPP